MKVPVKVGPSETWTEEELNAWLRKMEKWHLIDKAYILENGVGDWQYWATSLGVVVLRFLDALTKLRILKEKP